MRNAHLLFCADDDSAKRFEVGARSIVEGAYAYLSTDKLKLHCDRANALGRSVLLALQRSKSFPSAFDSTNEYFTSWLRHAVASKVPPIFSNVASKMLVTSALPERISCGVS
jgi:hypothetical protein